MPIIERPQGVVEALEGFLDEVWAPPAALATGNGHRTATRARGGAHDAFGPT
jgi:hypothetical protein